MIHDLYITLCTQQTPQAILSFCPQPSEMTTAQVWPALEWEGSPIPISAWISNLGIGSPES